MESSVERNIIPAMTCGQTLPRHVRVDNFKTPVCRTSVADPWQWRALPTAAEAVLLTASTSEHVKGTQKERRSCPFWVKL
jgi:hypothetical protein